MATPNKPMLRPFRPTVSNTFCIPVIGLSPLIMILFPEPVGTTASTEGVKQAMEQPWVFFRKEVKK